MTLKTYMRAHKSIDEFVVVDDTYDMETYFYNSALEDLEDDYNKAMEIVASKLQVVESEKEWVKVNFYDTIKASIPNLKEKDLRYSYSIDGIMEDLNGIISGYTSESWFLKFANALVKQKPNKEEGAK